jgi:hypothetical protein
MTAKSEAAAKKRFPFRKAITLNVALVLVCGGSFAYVYHHDARVAVVSPIVRMLNGLVRETHAESGSPSFLNAETATGFKVSFIASLEPQRDLFSELKGMIDDADIAYLKSTNAGRDVEQAIREIMNQLNATTSQSEQIASQAITDVKSRTTMLRNNVISAVGEEDHPWIFDLRPRYLERFAVLAEERTIALSETIETLDALANWHDGRMNRDIKADPAFVVSLMNKCEETCRASRVAFLLVYALGDGADRKALRTQFISAQRRAVNVTEAVETALRKSGGHLIPMADLLESYEESMRKRLELVGADPPHMSIAAR